MGEADDIFSSDIYLAIMFKKFYGSAIINAVPYEISIGNFYFLRLAKGRKRIINFII
jgi:hypothetical protein